MADVRDMLGLTKPLPSAITTAPTTTTPTTTTPTTTTPTTTTTATTAATQLIYQREHDELSW